MRLVPGLLLLTVGLSPLAAVDAPAGGSDEAYVLGMINSHRADPGPWDVHILGALRAGLLAETIEKNHFGPYPVRSRSPAQPLVLDAALTKAAQAGLARFTLAGVGEVNDPAPDLAAAGVTGSPATALLLAEGPAELRLVLETALLHPIEKKVPANGPTTYTMAREQLMRPAVTACGIAVAKTAQGYRLAVVLGDQVKGRVASGVMFRDVNRNGLFDQGEAVVATTTAVTPGGSPQTNPAGVWTVVVKEKDATGIVSTGDGLSRTAPLAAQGKSWIALPAPEKADIEEARKLLAVAAKAPKDADGTPDKSVFDLCFRRPHLALDDATDGDVTRVTEDATRQIDQARREVLDGINDDKAEMGKRLNEIQKRWKSRGPAWISFVKSYHLVNQQYGAWSGMEGDARVAGAQALSRAMAQLITQAPDTVLLGQILIWKGEVDLAIAAAEHKPAGADGKKKDAKKKKK